MRQTVVGVFERFAAAQHAADLLRQRGIDDDDIQVTAAEDEQDASQKAERHEGGLLERIRNFFSGDVDNDFEVSAYSEAVRRGGAVVKVDVEDEPEVEVAREALVSAGAVDIDERVEQGKAAGWSAGTSASDTGQRAASGRTTTQAEGEQVIPVVKEDVQVGKRIVKAGGVRVYARTMEEPVRESVDLREERARVERRPVDRPASEADLRAAAGERSIEVEETVERPVVQKTARVVEEVVVGKESRKKKADINETVRRTEVDVKSLGGDERARAYEAFDQEFRSDFSTRFGGSRPYEDYEPAYRFGHSLASDSRYAGQDWDAFETQAQSDWTRSNPGSKWEDMKAAVRHAWERAKS